MIKNLIDSRTYKFIDEDGKIFYSKIRYSIVVKDGTVQNVFNEYDNSVMKNSEVFEHFSNKYNHE